MDRFFTVNEIAASLKVERRTVIRWILSDQLKALKVGPGRIWRIREQDLKKFIKGR